LKQAGDSIQITRILWTDGSSAAMSAAGGSKAKVGQISKFDPTEVNKAAEKGESVSSPPPKAVKRQKLLEGVTDMKIGKTAEAELIVKSGYDSFEAAISQAHTYEESLKKSAKDVLETSDKTKDASEKIFQHKQTLKSTETQLNGLKSQLDAQKPPYDSGDSEAKGTIAGNLTTPIKDYNSKAQSAVSAFSAVETSAQAAKTHAEKTNAAVDKNFYGPTDGQIKKYSDSLAVFDTNISVLNAKLQGSKNSLVGGESDATALSKFRANMETALQDMRNGRQTLGNLKKEYDDAAESVTRASLGVPEAWNGKPKTN